MSDMTHQRVENGLDIVPPIPDIPQTPYTLEVSLHGEPHEMDHAHTHVRSKSEDSTSAVSARKVPLPLSPTSDDFHSGTELDVGRDSIDRIPNAHSGWAHMGGSQPILSDDKTEEGEHLGRAL